MAKQSDDPTRDLGFGAVVARESRQRLLNRNGSFNVVREGLSPLALATGILFSRFSRPNATILYSKSAVIAPYRGLTAFEFRVANARSNQLIELEARLLLSWHPPGKESRDFFRLKLERPKVEFFPLSWTIVHPIDEESPLWGATPEQLRTGNAEFLILLTGIDETFSQSVHSRSSYKPDEVTWGARFVNIFNPPRPDGVLSIDIGRLDEIEPAPLPRAG